MSVNSVSNKKEIKTTETNNVSAKDVEKTSAKETETSKEKQELIENKTDENESVETDFGTGCAISALQNQKKTISLRSKKRKLEAKLAEYKKKLKELKSSDSKDEYTISRKKRKYKKKIKSLENQIDEVQRSMSSNSRNSILSNIMSGLRSLFSSSDSDSDDTTSETSTSTTKASVSMDNADFKDMLALVYKSEGGYSNDPNDHGGATNLGITQATYTSYKGKYVDVKNITKAEADEIYYKNYFVASGADKLVKDNPQLAYAVFDAAVNHGVGWAKKTLNNCNGDVDKFMQLRKEYYIAIVRNNPSQKVFEKGWQNRWNNVYAAIDPNHKYEHYAV